LRGNENDRQEIEPHAKTREIDQDYTPFLMAKTNPAQPVVVVANVEAGSQRAEPVPMQIQTNPESHPEMDFGRDI
jgi:hypothetical protein